MVKAKISKRKTTLKKKNPVLKKGNVRKSSASKKEGKLVGKITHYFSNIGVAVIKLFAPLSCEDKIRIIGGEDTDFTQPVKSMEIEHKKIKKAKAKSEVGLKIKKQVREGYKVYKI